MIKLIRNFAKTINDGDLILFYFSGHGYQLNGKNYLIPVYDTILQNEKDVEEFAIDVEQVITLLAERNPSYANILILDCCRSYKLKNASASNGKWQMTRYVKSMFWYVFASLKGKGLLEIQPRPGVFIQFACAANQTVSNVGDTERNCLFAKHLIRNITEENVNVCDVFRGIIADVYRESNLAQRPLSMNGLQDIEQVYLKKVVRSMYHSNLEVTYVCFHMKRLARWALNRT